MTSVLCSPTLVLNKSMIAVNVEPLQDAITKVCTMNAEIIDPRDYQRYTWDDWKTMRAEEGEEVIACAHGLVRVPDVIVLTQFDRLHARNLGFTRKNLFARDQNTCQYCTKKFRTEELSIDHVIPQCQGGKGTWENCVLACVKCNVRKGGRTPKEANMKLMRRPTKPRWSPSFRTRIVKPTWERFVSDLYWNIELEQ